MAAPLSIVTFALCVLLLAVAVVAGGSSQYAMISTAVVELASLPLLGLGFWLAARRRFRSAAWPIAILAAGVAVAAAQLVPLPIGLWRALPGREAALSAMALAGAHPLSLPASLDPGATARSLVSAAPGAAIFLGILALDWELRRRLAWLLLGLCLVSAVIGMAQLTGRLSSFYTITNPGSAVGFFANRNHFAALLYACLPIAAALGRARRRKSDSSKWAAGAAAAIGAVLLLGVAASGSRAGLALAFVALLGCAALFLRDSVATSKVRRWAPALVVIGAVVVLALLQFTRIGALGQPKAGPIDEGRYAVTATTLGAANSYAPLGSGLGTFVPIYAAVEPTAGLSSEYFNHAHDDWAELWLEGGWPMAAVVIAFLGWCGLASIQAWKPPGGAMPPGAALSRAGSITVGLLLIHSTADYPLRTEAVMAVFGFACALLIPPMVVATATTSRRRRDSVADDGGRIRHRPDHAAELGAGAI